jgi:hypothetical protein
LEEHDLRALEDTVRDVVLACYPYDATAKYELSPGGAEVIASGSDDDDLTAAFIEAIRQLRHGLALAGLVGKLSLYRDDTLGPEETGAAERAMASFAEEELAVTWEDAARAYEEEEAAARRARERMEQLKEFMQAQQRDPDEPMTLGEAVERNQEGTERLHRMGFTDDSEVDDA